jgi:hypothetical protein
MTTIIAKSTKSRTFNQILTMFYEDQLTMKILNYNLKEHERTLFKNKLRKTPNKYLCGRALSKNQIHIIRGLWIMKCERVDDEKYHSIFTQKFCDDCKIGEMQSRFMKCKYVDGCHTECAICISPIKIGSPSVVLECNHTFHGGCINRWFKTKINCPCCRRNYSAFLD